VEHDTVVGTAERPALAYDAVLRPVRQGNAFEETVERLLQVIKLGMAPRRRLPAERDLSLRLGGQPGDPARRHRRPAAGRIRRVAAGPLRRHVRRATH
jgi:hypothetical protein